MFQLLIVIVVIGLVVLTLRANRQARTNWQNRINLPGVWLLESGKDRLELTGLTSHGVFQRTRQAATVTGHWELRGTQLLLQVEGEAVESLEFVFFDAGKISLQEGHLAPGIYLKESSNVVSLNQH